MVGGGTPKADDKEKPKGSASSEDQERGFGDPRHYVPRDIVDVSFPVAVRGYDRHAVDAYVKRVNRVIAELKVSASPPAAVRHALDQAAAKVDSLLEAARDAAEQVTASARDDAERTTGRAKAEAAELVVNTNADAERTKAEAEEVLANASAEADRTTAKATTDANEIVSQAKRDAEEIVTHSQADADERRKKLLEELAEKRDQAEERMREIHADTQTIWTQRDELLENIRTMARDLAEVANAAVARMPAKERAGQRQGLAETEPVGGMDEATAAPVTASVDEPADQPSAAENA